mgnify:CR=1 FL=1
MDQLTPAVASLLEQVASPPAGRLNVIVFREVARAIGREPNDVRRALMPSNVAMASSSLPSPSRSPARVMALPKLCRSRCQWRSRAPLPDEIVSALDEVSAPERSYPDHGWNQR